MDALKARITRRSLVYVALLVAVGIAFYREGSDAELLDPVNLILLVILVFFVLPRLARNADARRAERREDDSDERAP